jgi:GT2 family glycosyltransferase
MCGIVEYSDRIISRTKNHDLVYIVIVTYNAEQWLNRCFTSLNKSNYPCKTIVIDNDSQDNTVKLIQENFPEVEVYISDKNLGFGQGNNWGIKQALDSNADYLFLLNQDAWIEKDTIGELVASSKKNSKFGIISPIHLNGEYSGFATYFKKYIKKSLSQHTVAKIVEGKTDGLNEIYSIDFVNAAAWFLTASCIKKVGGFDPLFFHYGEDFNYLSRIKYHGFRIGLCPKTTICHDTSMCEKGKDITRLNNSSLAFVSDINKGLLQLYISEIIFLCGAIIFNLLRLKPKRSIAFLSFIFQIFAQLSNVKLSRNKNKIEGINYF